MQAVTLDDKYVRDDHRVYLTGIQALVRLTLVQRRRDLAAGLNTAGFISGYRGSPLGGLDEALWKAKKHLEAHHVKFQPGVNEELAATSVWGTQQVDLIGKAKYDGVFALWYGKFFVDTRLKFNVMRFEVFLGFPKGFVQAAERRATIT